MLKSDSIKELAAALSKAQGSMVAAKKDATNPFFKSKYADFASVVEAIKAPLAANGLSYSQLTDVDDAGVYIETILMHSSGEWLSGRLRMPVAKANDPQALGSAITYCRRYALQSLCGVPAEDDDGNAATGKPGVHRPSDGADESLSEAQRRKVQGVVDEAKLCFETSPLDCLAVLEGAKFDPDESVYAWTFFDSKERAAMKAAKARLKAT